MKAQASTSPEMFTQSCFDEVREYGNITDPESGRVFDVWSLDPEAETMADISDDTVNQCVDAFLEFINH